MQPIIYLLLINKIFLLYNIYNLEQLYLHDMGKEIIKLKAVHQFHRYKLRSIEQLKLIPLGYEIISINPIIIQVNTPLPRYLKRVLLA